MLRQEPLTSTGPGPHIFSTDPADSEKIGTDRAALALVDTETGSGQRAVPATPLAALRHIPALSPQALAGIQERLADCIQIDDNYRH